MEQMEEDGGLDPPDDSAASTDEHLLKEDERRAVQKTVAGLPEKYRLPIQLFYAADMSVQEIADIMRIPEGERCVEYEHLKVVGPSYEGTYNTQMQFGMSVPEELWSTNEDPKEGFHEDIDR